MRGVELGPPRDGNQPVPRDWHAIDVGSETSHLGGPLVEVHRAGKRSQQHELGEREIGLSGERDGRLERVLVVARQAKDERSEDMDAVFPEYAQARDEIGAGEVEPLVHILQPLFGDRLDANQGAANPRAFHGIQKRRILGGFHRDLGVEDEIVG